MKRIILYYSRSGNTEKLAKRIQADLGCDLIKIEPSMAYGSYLSSVGRVSRERKNHITPEFRTPIPNLADYDMVFIGYPIWAQDMPVFIADYISKCSLSGKIVVPFATYGLSNIHWTMKTVEKVCREAEVKLPYSEGVFNKGKYDEWLDAVKKLKV